MGFGFDLFGLPLLAIITIGLLVYFVITKSKTTVKILIGLWLFVISLFVIATAIRHTHQPMRLTKEQIVGNYRIDRNFYKGKNADWQYEHYRFTITPTDSFFLYVTNEGRVIQTVKYKLKYSDGLPNLWTIQGDTMHHLIKYGPILFRGHNKFYYVFHTDIYGNMFFRKEN